MNSDTFANKNGENIPFLVYAKMLKCKERAFYDPWCVKWFCTHFRSDRYRETLILYIMPMGFDSCLVVKGMLKEGLSPQQILTTGVKFSDLRILIIR